MGTWPLEVVVNAPWSCFHGEWGRVTLATKSGVWVLLVGERLPMQFQAHELRCMEVGRVVYSAPPKEGAVCTDRD